MIVDKNKFETYEKNKQSDKKVLNAMSYEKFCKTVKSHNLLTVCQENYERSFGKHISQEFKIGK